MRIVPAAAAACWILGSVALSAPASPGDCAAPSAGAAEVKSGESPFACNRAALTPEERKRHFEELGPLLRSMRTGVRELPDGYQFQFSADPATYRLITEWSAGERACCPFFDVDVRSTREGGPLLLSLTGREGVKKFIEADGAAWLEK
jgi:hypothetical protein